MPSEQRAVLVSALVIGAVILTLAGLLPRLRTPQAALAVGALAGLFAGAWAAHKYHTCEPCRSMRRRLGLRWIE